MRPERPHRAFIATLVHAISHLSGMAHTLWPVQDNAARQNAYPDIEEISADWLAGRRT